MQVRLCPLTPSETSLLEEGVDASGTRVHELVGDTLAEAWPFCESKVLVADRHGLVLPHHWPLRLVRSLVHQSTEHEPLQLWFARAPRPGPRARPEPSEERTLKLRDVHPFSTPEYRNLVEWLLDEDRPTVQEPSSGGRYAHAGRARVRALSDGSLLTWDEWLACHPRRTRDEIPLEVMHRDGRLLLGTYGGADFVFADPEEEEEEAAASAPPSSAAGGGHTAAASTPPQWSKRPRVDKEEKGEEL